MVGGVDRATINCVKRIDRIASEDPDEDSCRWTGHCASINRRSQYATDLIDCVALSGTEFFRNVPPLQLNFSASTSPRYLTGPDSILTIPAENRTSCTALNTGGGWSG